MTQPKFQFGKKVRDKRNGREFVVGTINAPPFASGFYYGKSTWEIDGNIKLAREDDLEEVKEPMRVELVIEKVQPGDIHYLVQHLDQFVSRKTKVIITEVVE